MNDPAEFRDFPGFPEHADPSDSALRLERAYRRRLACYPRAWRRENEEEILAVLLACAAGEQRRPGLAASADLLKGAVRLRLRPRPAQPRTVRAAVALMCAGALVELGVVITVMATAGSLRTSVLHHYPALTTAQWHMIVLHLTADKIGGPIVALVWLWLAWANSRGYDWARPAFMAFFAFVTASVLIALGEGAAVYAPADLIAAAALWLVGLAAMLLIFGPRAGQYYRPPATRAAPARR